MDLEKCDIHKAIPKSIYCMDCKCFQCPNCLTSPTCKTDHKKTKITEIAREIQKSREDDIAEITHLFTEIVHMEKKLDSTTKKLEEMKDSKYRDILNALKIIYDRIEAIYKLQNTLPNDAQICKNVVTNLKMTLVSQLTEANIRVQQSQKLLEEKKYVEYMKIAAPAIPLSDHTEAYKNFYTLQQNVKYFFNSLNSFSQAFIISNSENQFEKIQQKHAEKLEIPKEELRKSVQQELLEESPPQVNEKSNKKTDVNDASEIPAYEITGQDSAKVDEIIAEKMQNIFEKNQGKLTDRLNDLEEKIKQIKETTEQQNISKSEIQALLESNKKSERVEPIKQDEGLKLNFASFLNLSELKSYMHDLPENGDVYIVGIKNGIQATELAGLLWELGEMRYNIEKLSLHHLYLSDLLPFKYTFEHINSLKCLELLSCPFSTSQLENIVKKINESKHQLESLSIENALLGEDPAELIKEINQTNIRHLKITNPKMKVGKFIETLKNNLSDKIEIIDLGIFKSDPRTLELIKEWSKTKKIIYTDDQSTLVTRNTYKY